MFCVVKCLKKKWKDKVRNNVSKYYYVNGIVSVAFTCNCKLKLLQVCVIVDMYNLR